MQRNADINSNIDHPKILIVDDRKENLVATRRVLQKLDADILEANSGNEALSMMLRYRFAVVLLDVQMPEMDGFETASLMREDENMRHIPVIFVTAISKEEHYANHAAELGAVDYIFKPINPSILQSKVQVYVNQHVQNQSIKRLNSILMQNNEDLERFAYICSHDLKEPARNVLSFAKFFKEIDPKTRASKGGEYIDAIIDSAQRMLDLIQGILDYSRIGSKSETYIEVDCNQVLQRVLLDFKHNIKSKNVTIHCANELPIIRGNEIQIIQLFQNLIGNAMKFNNSNEITVEIDCLDNTHEWQFSFKDNGLGIDSKYHKRIFTMFQRLHRREDYPGSGVGLPICQKIIKEHHGRIWVKSIPNQGSTFYFTFPKTETLSEALNEHAYQQAG